VVRGDCKDGYQDIHYLAIPKSACYLASNSSWPKVQKCEGHLPFDVEVNTTLNAQDLQRMYTKNYGA